MNTFDRILKEATVCIKAAAEKPYGASVDGRRAGYAEIKPLRTRGRTRDEALRSLRTMVVQEWDRQNPRLHDFADGAGGIPARRHPLGRGWVADTAEVAKSAQVELHASVYNEARVLGDAQISDRARVYGNAFVDDEAEVRGNARVHDNAHVVNHAVVEENAEVADHARISDAARISGNARIRKHATVYNHTVVSGNAVASGSARRGDLRHEAA